MKINPSPSFSIDLTVESTLSRQELEDLITAAEGVCALSTGAESPFCFTVNCRSSEHQQEIFQTL
jgi:hypothetical protein